ANGQFGTKFTSENWNGGAASGTDPLHPPPLQLGPAQRDLFVSRFYAPLAMGASTLICETAFPLPKPPDPPGTLSPRLSLPCFSRGLPLPSGPPPSNPKPSFAISPFNQLGLFLCEVNSQCFFDHAENFLRSCISSDRNILLDRVEHSQH